MSQPKIYGPKEQDPLFLPIKNQHQLLDIFVGVERHERDWLIGIEYEMFGQINNGKTPLPYLGEISVTRLFNELIKKTSTTAHPFLPVYEGQNVVALSNQKAVIALEPGGQIELAPRPYRNLSELRKNFSALVLEIETAAKGLDIDLFACGLHPLASRNQMAHVKKIRYDIMQNYMGGLSGLGLDMMTRSCAIQINLDFADESDMAEKTRLAALLVPFYALLSSSSVFVDGKKTSHAIERGHIWRNTDQDRTGIPSVIFEKDFGYEAWIDLALDVPMYFIRRDNTYHDVAGASFRDFIAHGLIGQQAMVRDFVDHLTTIFTEVRLKPILELRSPDSLPVVFVNAWAAFSWALFYHRETKNRALEIFDGLSYQELKTFHHNVIDRGLEAELRGQKIFAIMKNLLSLAEDALKGLAFKLADPELSTLLSPLIQLVDQNVTVAEWISRHFKTIDENAMPSFIKYLSPSHPALPLR